MDDSRTSNTHIAQRKRAIPHSTTKNNRNIIECCNNTHQGAPRTGKQTCSCASDLGDGSHVTYDNNSVTYRLGANTVHAYNPLRNKKGECIVEVVAVTGCCNQWSEPVAGAAEPGEGEVGPTNILVQPRCQLFILTFRPTNFIQLCIPF